MGLAEAGRSEWTGRPPSGRDRGGRGGEEAALRGGAAGTSGGRPIPAPLAGQGPPLTATKQALAGEVGPPQPGLVRWAGKDSNLRRRTGRFTVCSLWPLGHRPADAEGYRLARRYCIGMPTFDIVSEVDMQEVRNAVDQANREATTRFDFKGTDSTIELTDKECSSLLPPRTGSAPSTRSSRRSWSSARCHSSPSRSERSRKPPRVRPPEDRHPGRYLLRPRQEDQQVHQGAGQGRHVPDPGRSAPGDRQEAGRPPGGDRRAARRRISASPSSSTTSATERLRVDRGSPPVNPLRPSGQARLDELVVLLGGCTLKRRLKTQS